MEAFVVKVSQHEKEVWIVFSRVKHFSNKNIFGRAWFCPLGIDWMRFAIGESYVSDRLSSIEKIFISCWGVFVLNHPVRGFRFGCTKISCAHNVETLAWPQHCPTSNSKYNLSGTKLSYSLLCCWRTLYEFGPTARADLNQASLLLHSENRKKNLNSPLNWSNNIAARSCEKHSHFSVVNGSNRADVETRKKHCRLTLPWMNYVYVYSVHRSSTFTMELLYNQPL